MLDGRRPHPRRRHRLRTTLLALSLIALSPTSRAATGEVHRAAGPDQGNIDFSLFFLFPPSEDDIDQVREAIIEASGYICDATEGQMRFGEVVMTGGGESTIGKQAADVWVYPQEGRASADLCLAQGDTCIGLETEGKRVRMFMGDFTAWTLAHEMGHHALGLGDEYSEVGYLGANCGATGRCIDAPDATDQNNCLMQGADGDISVADELCTAGGHDPISGDPMIPMCTAEADLPPECNRDCDCTDDLWFTYNPDTCSYEGAYQTAWSLSKTGEVRDCWSQVEWTFPEFANAPAGLPEADTAPCTDPMVIEEIAPSDRIMLVLDRSWSMNFHPDEEQCQGWPSPACPEICNNGSDDDADGMIDEAGCSTGRLERLQESAKGFLDLLNASPGLEGGFGDMPFGSSSSEAGIVSFSCGTSVDSEPITVDNSGQDTLEGIIDDLEPGGKTAIGDALALARTTLEGQEEEANDAVFLITDGHHNCGDTLPEDETDNLIDADIQVFSLVLGSAGNQDVLAGMAAQTGGRYLQTDDFRSLFPEFVKNFAVYSNTGLLIPKLPYRVNAERSVGEFDPRGPSHWLDGNDQPIGDPGVGTPIYNSNLFEVPVEDGVGQLVLALGGDMESLEGFGLRVLVDGPSGEHFDTDLAAADPAFAVRESRHYMLLILTDPAPGTWRIDVRTAFETSGQGDVIQTGHLSVLASNPNVDLYVSLDDYFVDTPGQALRAEIDPSWRTPLRDAVVEATLHRPDGSVIPLTVDEDILPGHYLGNVDGILFEGLYELRVRLQTVAGTTNDPGESLFSDAPPTDVPVPILERTASVFFYSTQGSKVCVDPNDCDGDGVLGESRENDGDGDGLVDSCDPDSDGDGLPDPAEWPGFPIDTDGDGTADYLDTDSDGDGADDDSDPGVGRGNHQLRINDVDVSTWGEATEAFVYASHDEPVTVIDVGMTWNKSVLDVVSIELGPDVPPENVASLTVMIGEPGGLQPGEATARIELVAGKTLDPAIHRRVLKLSLLADTVAGRDLDLCLSPRGEAPRPSTFVVEDTNGNPQTVFPSVHCGEVVSVGDTRAPDLDCPDDVVVDAGMSCTFDWTEPAIALDSCDPAPTLDVVPSLPAMLFGAGEHVVTYTATDESGNASACATTVTLECTGDLFLTQGPLVRGQATAFEVLGALPGETVVFLRSLAGTGSGPCPPELGGGCLDLLAPFAILGQAVAGADGRAVLTFTIPPQAPLADLSTEAAVLRGPGGVDSVTSNAITAPITDAPAQ